ncbi:ABC transporter permease [Streptomyces sp. G-G2]|uniref:ABC transporter permease n=1 Tax=Streptomyces sp. G-G2 TaxID=3046201 RepID=UPI0024B9CAE9|nr:ABC transporter permease [Streptomyces sp. G-G2]MDJ0383536.1 ABC transporter permease [Streptomyces sp. G-G2]
MITTWLAGLLRHRGGRLLVAALTAALAVALIAALGTFLTASRSTMTARAGRSVAVDWQIQLQPSAQPATVLDTIRHTPGIRTALPVTYARSASFQTTAAGSVQSTGEAVVLGIPDGYRTAFPGEIRPLTGARDGVLLAQQTAANLHAAPGDTVRIALPGTAGATATVTVAGVVDLPQADSLFQKVGAPPQSQPAAPPDNVMLLPAALFDSLTARTRELDPAAVTTQVHAARDARLPADPAAAFSAVGGAAHHLEARLSGAVQVGDNLGAALDAARQDALYAQLLFLFLGAPGVVLATLLTSALASVGADRRRREQALLRTRGLGRRRLAALAGVEAAAIGLGGGLLGVALAALAGRIAFGQASFGAVGLVPLRWSLIALALGAAVAAVSVLLPAVRDQRTTTVTAARRSAPTTGTPLWQRTGLDFILLALSYLVFRASAGNQYALVLAPEGVASISVSYWAFLGPALLWLGSALLLWRLTTYALAHGRRPLTFLVRPLTGTLAAATASGMARQRRILARSVVLLALAVSFALSTAAFNTTYRHQAEVDAQLTNGADVTVTQPPGAAGGPAAGRALAAVPGVRRVEPLQHRFAYVGSDLQDLYGVNPATITSATALQDTYFAGGSARSLLAKLASRPDSVLVSEETVKDFQLAPGDRLNLRLQDERTKQLRTVAFHYAGVVKEFPTAPKDSFFVANADYVARQSGSDAVGAFLVDTGGAHQRAVAARLRERLGATATVTDLTQTRSAVGSSLTSVDLAGLTWIELAFAVALAAGAGGAVLALGLTERRRTFAVATVLGATRGQLRGMVLAEAATVALGGLTGGAVLGWALAHMLVKVLTGVFDPPPSTLSLPWPYLGLTLLTTLAALTAAALHGARRSGRPAVEELREP